MATNRASMPDSYLAAPPSPPSRLTRTDDAPGADAPRRLVMVVGGLVVALVSLAIGSIALVQVWMQPAAADGAAAAPTLQSWEALAMIIGGGVGFAAGAALIGIGMGRWTSPRRAESEADYTGPGDVHETPNPPRVV
jgi:hypothetical protein